MVIANPIYDVVFKKLMENESIAKFFIGTILEQNIEELKVKPKAFSYLKNDEKELPDVKKDIKEQSSIYSFRSDFIATILTDAGERKKVHIEIQKVKNNIDLMQLRDNLGKNYDEEDTGYYEKQILPIVTIYILGFNLPEFESACIQVKWKYTDLISNKNVNVHIDFIEKEANDYFIIQVNRITERYESNLDKLLSIFEQSHFLDGGKIIKDFKHDIDNEDVKLITDILHKAGVDPDQKKLMEIEKGAL
jgi:hypothetical protein